MKSVAGLTVLSLAQANMLRHATPARHVHFLGSGKNHSNEIFHAVISAQNLNSVKDMTVSYYDCGDNAGCGNTSTIMKAGSLRDSAFNITETGENDGGYSIFDVEYDNTNGPTVNHLLTVFSDGLGEESIICGVNKEIKEVSDAADTCEDCGAGATAGLYDITCTNNVCKCSDGTATVYNGTGGTLCDTNGQEDCSECNSGYKLDTDAAAGTASTCVACTPPRCPSGEKISGDDVCTQKCVAKSKMFGYVIVTSDGINGCCSVCASWYGQLEQGFNQTADINRLQADNEICGLLKTDGPMIASSQAAGETACNIFTEQVQCVGVK